MLSEGTRGQGGHTRYGWEDGTCWTVVLAAHYVSRCQLSDPYLGETTSHSCKTQVQLPVPTASIRDLDSAGRHTSENTGTDT